MRRHEDGQIILIALTLMLWLAAGLPAQTPDSSTPPSIPSPDSSARSSSDTMAIRTVDGLVVSASLGTGSRKMGGQLSVWLQKGRNTFSLRTAGVSDFEIFSPSESESDWALLFGRRTGSEGTWARIAAGPGLVELRRTGNAIDCFFFCTYEVDQERSLGLAFHVDGVLGLARFIGLGISAFGNVNPQGSFAAAALTLHLGAVR